MPVILSSSTTLAAKRWDHSYMNFVSFAGSPVPYRFMLQVNAVSCNTSWKVTLFMKFSDYKEDILKGVCSIAAICVEFLVKLFELVGLMQTCYAMLMCLLAGRCGEALPRRAGEVSDLRRLQEKAACLPPYHTTTVCHLCHQLQGSLGS